MINPSRFESPSEDRGRFAIEKIEIGEIYRNIVSGLGFDFQADAFEQPGVFAEQLALDPQLRVVIDIVVNLIDPRCHFVD